jgi:hypothetical protein
MNSQIKPRGHTLEQLQEMLVCAIVRKQLSAIDPTIEYVIPTVLHSDAQGRLTQPERLPIRPYSSN